MASSEASVPASANAALAAASSLSRLRCASARKRRVPPDVLPSIETEDTSDSRREEHDMSTTTYGFETTAAEVVDGLDLTGKRMIVTGAASGIGVETARALAGAGAEVTLAVRDTAAGDRTAADIGGDVRVAP